MKSLVKGIALIAICMLWMDTAYANVIFEDNFDSYGSSITKWQVAEGVSLEKSGGIDNSACAKVTYSGAGTPPYWFRYKMNANTSEVYVKFHFKMDNPSGGSKFLKLFGKNGSPSGYANTTFGLNYFSNTLREISYGAGHSVNDTQDVIRYDGTHTDSKVVIEGSTKEFKPTSGKWHLFEAHMKFNDNGKRNGFYQVWIDGESKIHATNVVNRNDSNSPHFDSIDLANYCNSNWSKTWHLWYDNVVIADSYAGAGGVTQPSTPPVDTAPPSAPTGMKIVQ